MAGSPEEWAWREAAGGRRGVVERSGRRRSQGRAWGVMGGGGAHSGEIPLGVPCAHGMCPPPGKQENVNPCAHVALRRARPWGHREGRTQSAGDT